MLPEIDGFYSIGMCQIIKYKNILQIFLGQRWCVLLAHHERHDTEGGPAHRGLRQPGEDGDTIGPPMMSSHSSLQDQVSSLIRNVRSSRIFDSSFDANRSFDSDFVPSTGMQKSCTASSIVDLGNDGDFRCDSLEIFGNWPGFHRKCVDTMYVSI